MERVNAIVSEKESGKVVFSDYVTPDENGKVNVSGLKPKTEYRYIITRPEPVIPAYKLVEKGA